MDFFTILTQPQTLHSIILSAEVGLATIVLHLTLGVIFGYILSLRFAFREVLDAFVTLPLVFPPIAIGFFLLMLFGSSSSFGRFLNDHFGIDMVFSFSGLVLAAFIAGLPLIVKPVQSAIEGAAKELMEASFAVGAGKIATFYHVVLPTIKSSVIAGLILAFGRSLGEVGISLILGGNIVGKTDTVSLSILNAVLDGDFDRAWALSALLGVIALGIFWVLKNALSIKKIQ